MPKPKPAEQQRYRQMRSGARSHFKWDQRGLGRHEAYCSQCKRIVRWEPLEQLQISQFGKSAVPSSKRLGLQKPGLFGILVSHSRKFNSGVLESVSAVYRVYYKMRSGRHSSRTVEADSTEEVVEQFNERNAFHSEIQSIWKQVARKSGKLEIVE